LQEHQLIDRYKRHLNYLRISITDRCNLRCRFCQFLEILEQKSPATLLETEGSLEQIRGIIDQVPPHTLITLSGGEPLLRQDFCDIAAYACRRHKVHIITNGILMDEAITLRLMELPIRNPLNDGLFWISFSLEGDRETHDRLLPQEAVNEGTSSRSRMCFSCHCSRSGRWVDSVLAASPARGKQHGHGCRRRSGKWGFGCVLTSGMRKLFQWGMRFPHTFQLACSLLV